MIMYSLLKLNSLESDNWMVLRPISIAALAQTTVYPLISTLAVVVNVDVESVVDVRERRVAVKPIISSGTFTIVWKSILNCATRTLSLDNICQKRSSPLTLQVKTMISSGQGRSSLLVRLASPIRVKE